MDATLTNNLFTFGYLLVWILTLLWYHHKVHIIDGGTAIIGFYIVYAVSSISTINDELFSLTYLPLTLLPYLYLYGMLMLAMSPVIYHHNHPTTKIEDAQTRMLFITGLIIMACTVLLIPGIIKNFGTGIVKLFLDSEAGNDAYMEKAKEASDSGSAISNIPSIIYNSLADIGIFLAFYFLTFKKKKIWLVVGLFAATILGFVDSVAQGQRTAIMLGLFTLIGSALFFRPYLSKTVNKSINIIGIVCVSIVTLPVIALTLSRFGDRKTGSVMSFLNWYIGQGSLYFNNYALDAGGTRNGERTMNLFLKLVKDDVPNNYVECRYKYPSLKINDHLFTTFVGDFVIDFGPLAAIVIFVVFNLLVLSQIRARCDTIKVHQLLLLHFVLCINLQGGMYLFNYSFTANIRIITFVMLYAYLRSHEALLLKFPKEQEAVATA